MATVQTMLDKLSEEIGDSFKSTTTSDASGVNDLIDTELKKYDDDDFIDKYETSFYIEGAVTAQGEENFATSKTDATVTMRGDYTALIPNSTAYSIHKLFPATQKNRAVERIRKSIFPLVFTEAQYEFDIVADQYTYDISAAAFEDPNGTFRDIMLVDSQDSEITSPRTHWEMVPGQTAALRFLTLPPTGETIRLIGIQTALLTDYSNGDEEIVVAHAAASLFLEGIMSKPGDVASRSTSSAEYWRTQARIQERKYKKIPPAIREPLGFELGVSGQTFLTS